LPQCHAPTPQELHLPRPVENRAPADRTTSGSAQSVAKLPQPNSRALAAQGRAVATALWGLNIPSPAWPA